MKGPVDPVALPSVPREFSGFAWKNVTVTFWLGPLSASGVDVLARNIQAVVERHPEGLSSLNVMVPGAKGLPDSATRAELGRLVQQYASHAAAIGGVVPGTG